MSSELYRTLGGGITRGGVQNLNLRDFSHDLPLMAIPVFTLSPHRGIHFLAVQPDPDSEELNGLWLLQDRAPPQI